MAEAFLLKLHNGAGYPYHIVHSKRAKYIRIKLSNKGELSVVLPPRISVKHAHEFITRKAMWVEKNLAKIDLSSTDELPDRLELELLKEVWSIDYEYTEIATIQLIETSADSLKLTGNTDDHVAIKKALNGWCQKKSKIVFNKMLERLAEKHGFHYKRLSIRSQKTRWGSCSSGKNINLNSKLLLFSEGVVQYVMIHELCHTIEMNHSHRFWKLVEECDPDYQSNRRLLKQQGKRIFL